MMRKLLILGSLLLGSCVCMSPTREAYMSALCADVCKRAATAEQKVNGQFGGTSNGIYNSNYNACMCLFYPEFEAKPK